MSHTAEIIAVGTELLLGNITNTNASEISRALSAVGVNVFWHTVVGDNPERLREALKIARKRADLLIFTGGLGPTYDDLTKETVCRVLDVPLTFHPEAAADIRRNFDTIFHREMPPGTLRQAELPEGCEVFCNRVGTAPGCVFHAGDVTAVLLPGVPSECRYLTETALLPWLRRQSSETILSHDLRIFGLSEPQVQELLGDRSIDEGRLVTEAAIFADKTAIDEETVRLHSHVAQYREILELDEPIGRKLDFLTQELNRESNTIGSKCQDVAITRLVVELKSEIEKIREQIQNIE